MNLFEMLEVVRPLSGDYCECGVYRGDTAVQIAERMPDGATLWLFDSFSGHGEPGPFDDSDNHPKGRYADTDPGLVLKRLPVNVELRLMIGYIPSTLRRVPLATNFRFVHIDVDHYEPTLAACKFFVPRMVPGGIIRFDDYEAVRGATHAIDEAVGRPWLLPGDWRYEAPLMRTA